MGPDLICMDTFNSHMRQTKSIRFMSDASVASHVCLANIIYGVDIEQLSLID